MAELTAPSYSLHPGVIGPFTRSWYFLSNFYPLGNFDFEWCGREWRTLEHAYQASKCVRAEEASKIWAAETPAEAKKLGRTVELAQGWEENKLDLMLALLRKKFANPHLARLLVETGDRELVEVNDWGDTFWGVVIGQRIGAASASPARGYNYLGLLLMLVREEIRNNTDVPWLVGEAG